MELSGSGARDRCTLSRNGECQVGLPIMNLVSECLTFDAGTDDAASDWRSRGPEIASHVPPLESLKWRNAAERHNHCTPNYPVRVSRRHPDDACLQQ